MLPSVMWKILTIALGELSVILLGTGDSWTAKWRCLWRQLVYKSGVGTRVCTEDINERVIALEWYEP